jgi:PIN domain nuclease of toxin-antitoxin system
MMRVLLDTHILFWWFYEHQRLSAAAFEFVRDADAVFFSSASIWEVAIKSRIGKIAADPRELLDQIARNDFLELPVRSKHALLVATLPLHHSDPFDRLLVAQAISEPLRLITADARLKAYGELVIKV